MAVTSSCSSFFNLRSNTVEPPARATTRRGSSHGCGGKLDGVGMWLMNGFATAFFASMERLSCIRINTHEDEGEDANDVPLIHGHGNHVVKNQAAPGVNKRRNLSKGLKRELGSFVED